MKTYVEDGIEYEIIYKPKNQDESDELYLWLQWPEDLEKAKRLVAPTNITEMEIIK